MSDDIFEDIDDDGKDTELYKSDIRELVRTASNRRIIYDHLLSVGTFSGTFNPEPYLNAYIQGKREAGLSLLDTIKNASPELYKLMMNKNE